MKRKVHDCTLKTQQVTVSVVFIFQYFYVAKIPNFYFLVMPSDLFPDASEQNIFQFFGTVRLPYPLKNGKKDNRPFLILLSYSKLR